MLYLFKFYFVCFFVRACIGLLNSSLEGRIVKGYKVDIDRYPHSVFLYFQHYIPKACGSSLIMDRAVVTAAHCLDELKYHNGKITAFLGSNVPIHSKIVRHIVDYHTHPKFNAEKGRYNLGIAFFNSRVPLNRYVEKIPISIEVPRPNDALYTSGWGKQMSKKFPDYSDMRPLKASKQRVITTRECGKHSGFSMSPAYWCTVPINGYHYHGDAGNGLVTKSAFLVGVVSYMINDVTVYSDVTRELRWIHESILSLFDKC